MPTFYFHLRKDGKLIADQEGDEFQNLDDVREEAIAAARQIIAFAPLEGRDARDYSFLITDDRAQQVLEFQFKEAMTDQPDRN